MDNATELDKTKFEIEKIREELAYQKSQYRQKLNRTIT